MMAVEHLLGAIVVLAVLAFVVLPLLPGRQTAAATVQADDAAEARAAIYQELLELELDQKVGKIADSDYCELSDALLARAATMISEEDARDSAADGEVEREIAEMRKTLRARESATTRESGS
jgi:hypothetical protein